MRVSGYEENMKYYRDKALKLEQQNKRYRNFIKTVSDPWEIARKIGKETDKNIIRADEVVGWIKREAERIMGEE